MSRIALGNVTIDRTRYEVEVGKRRVALTFVEFELLYQLARNAGRVVSRNRLLANVWNESGSGDDRKVTVHMSRLRKKMSGSDPWKIEPITRRGYIFTEDRAAQDNQNGTDPSGQQEEE